MVSCDSAVDSQGAFPLAPDAPLPGESVDAGEEEASFPLHLDTCPPPLRPRLQQQLQQRAFPPELAGAAVAEVGVLAEPECTAPDAFVATADADAHPSSFPPWWGDIRFPLQLLPSLRGLSAFRTSQMGPVVPTMLLHCRPVSLHCIDLERSIKNIVYHWEVNFYSKHKA